MARRARSAGRRSQRAGAAPAGASNFDLLGLYGDNRTAFSFLEGIDSPDAAFQDMESVARERTSDDSLADAIAKGERLGAVWRLLDLRSHQPENPWTVNVGPDYPIKEENLVPIQVAVGTRPGVLPATGRGVVQTMIHQRDLVEWDNSHTNGTILFVHLRANQRALLTSFSVQHLGTCLRIFTARPNALNAVRWVRGALEDGKIQGRLRRAEGLEYVANCVRIYDTYNTTMRTKGATEEDGLKAAQKAIAPRGGQRVGGEVSSPTQSYQRMMALAAHLLATVARAGLETPFLKAFPNPRALGFYEKEQYSDAEQRIYNEVDEMDSPTAATATKGWAELSFPTAASQYLFTYRDDGGKDELPEDANIIRVPAGDERTFAWQSAVTPTPAQQAGEREEVTRSERTYTSRARAVAFGRRAHPNAEVAVDAPDRIRAVEVTVDGETRWAWERVQRIGREPLFTFTSRAEAQAALDARRDELADRRPEIREIQGEGGSVIYGVFGDATGRQRQTG